MATLIGSFFSQKIDKTPQKFLCSLFRAFFHFKKNFLDRHKKVRFFPSPKKGRMEGQPDTYATKTPPDKTDPEEEEKHRSE